MFRTWTVLVLAVITGLASPALAKAPQPSDEEWRAAHIAELPREVSKEVYKWRGPCGVLKARSTFSRITEIGGRRYLALHFEQLHCEDRTALCSAAGCLHEVYEFRHGRFQKIKSLRTSELQVVPSDGQAALEFDCRLLGCLRVLKWDGTGFGGGEKQSFDNEHIFGFTEGADVGKKGESELESTFTSRFGRPGEYGVLENETAARYVFAEGLRASIGLLSEFHRVRGVPDLQDNTSLNFNGISGELRWQLLDRLILNG
jgi:hypothetical protein